MFSLLWPSWSWFVAIVVCDCHGIGSLIISRQPRLIHARLSMALTLVVNGSSPAQDSGSLSKSTHKEAPLRILFKSCKCLILI